VSWPHILSLSRVVASPVVAALVLGPPGDGYLVAAVIFTLASLTDLIDGKLARYAQRESPFGVFLDTTSDKVLVSLVLVALAISGLVPAWIPLLIIGREFLISGLRSFAAASNRIISAHIWGKGKAALTMAAIPLVLAAADGRAGGVLAPLGNATFWHNAYLSANVLLALAALLTVISGVRYLIDARPLFRPHAVEPPSDEQRIAAGGR